MTDVTSNWREVTPRVTSQRAISLGPAQPPQPSVLSYVPNANLAMRYTRTQTVLKTTPASWRDSHSRRAKGSPLSSARRCGRQRAQHRRVQVAKRVAEVLQREAVQGERRVRQHVPRPNNAQHSALRGAPAVDTTCSDLQWTVAAKHRGVPLGGDAGGSQRHLKGHQLSG